MKTICYPFTHRINFKYWIQLKTGRYVVTPRASIIDCIRAYIGCQAYGLTFKVEPRSSTNQMAYYLLLNLFYNRLTDREHFTNQKSVSLTVNQIPVSSLKAVK